MRTLGRLVDDLFELARIDAGAHLELHDAQLAGVVQACFRGSRPRRTRAASASRPISPTARLRTARRDQVERVLLNLLTNALRHTPADGSIAVRVEPARDEVQVTVEDTGTGLEPEGGTTHVRSLLARGSRPLLGRGTARGSGLAIARGLVEAHGGRIWAENRPGGARISFTLPARRVG